MTLLLALTDVDAQYAAVAARDATQDGSFWYGVTTTHVFCMPSCAATTPRAENVEFFSTPTDALRAGFRPCRRCRPLGDRADHLVEAVVSTPLGDMVAIGNEHGLTLLEFTDRPMLKTQRERLQRLFQAAPVVGEVPVFQQLRDELGEYFAGTRTNFTVPLLPLGTPFQRAVWRNLAAIPHGQTTSYDAIASALGKPLASRAVGRANGDNRVSIVLPCHRVVGADGSLTGYGGGLWRKRALLQLEGAYDDRGANPYR